jgi:hypothetical protein
MNSGFVRTSGKILLAATLALLLAGVVQARTSSKVIATGVLLKGGKISYAQGTAKGPKTVSAKVIAVPAQPVKIQYSLTCTKGGTADEDAYNSSTTPSSGQFTATTSLARKLTLPFAKPTSCSVIVYATISKKGKETLTVLQD